jgi:hypothetical protein
MKLQPSQPMKKLFIILSLSLLSLITQAGYPSILTLKDLIDKSEDIVYGTVISKSAIDTVMERQCLDTNWVGCKAILYEAKVRIIKEFKGYSKSNVISIAYYFGPGYYCNTLKPNDTIIAFLQKGNMGDWISNHCVFGDKTLTSRGLNEYLDRINDLPSNMLFNDSKAYDRLLTEWYVKCAGGYYSSWEGMYKITDYKNPIELSPEQKTYLKTSLLSFIPFEFRHTELLNYVSGFDKSPELKSYILKNLRKLDKSSYFLTAYELMSAYTRIENNEALKQILEQYRNSKISQDPERGYSIVQNFINSINFK